MCYSDVLLSTSTLSKHSLNSKRQFNFFLSYSPRIRIDPMSDHINTILDFYGGVFSEGKIFQVFLTAITPATIFDDTFGNDFQFSRYIWGMSGDFVFSKTLKCKHCRLFLKNHAILEKYLLISGCKAVCIP